jgi:2-polyprenyl-3-methyl-5-hydroxy-6-metoxy-1,4-benzoquinol methylase
MSVQTPSTCPLCGSAERRPYLRVEGYQIVQCQDCRFLCVSSPPPAAELAALYQQQDYYKGDLPFGYTDYFAQRASHEALARARLRRIERLLPRRGRILDVGCAAGFFLKVAQQRGWEVEGVEISQDMAAYATQLIGRPIAARLAGLDAGPGAFDAITCWEYIEHIADPRDEVLRLVQLLKPGGVLALSTPNTRYWTAVHWPERWQEFKPPAHLGFFTATTLREMLAACGLEVVALPRTQPRAPGHPYAAQRLLELLRRKVGNGAERRTPLWWTFSLAWRLVERSTQAAYALRWPDSDIALCIEAYARKPL